MADLTRFIAHDARTGGKFDVYIASIRVGNGDFVKVEPLSVHVRGAAGGVIPVKGEVEITMPDTAPSGVCTVIFIGNVFNDCRYSTDGGTLVIDTPVTQLRLQANDRSYTWVQAKGIWAGLWTTNSLYQGDFLADGPAGEAAPVREAAPAEEAAPAAAGD